MDSYTKAVTSIPCPRCQQGVGVKCNTSSVVHAERRNQAIDEGLWSPEAALRGVLPVEHGTPLEAFKPRS